MAPATRPEHHINLNYIPQLTPPAPHSGSSTGNTSPVEPSNGGSVRFPPNTSNPVPAARLGAGSPSHEYGSRLFSKRLVAP
jgi:protein JSN1